MNRKELAQIIADKTSLPFNKANAAIGEFLISVREAVKRGEEVRRRSKARRFRNV